jgi:hypothetical protein
MVAAFRPRKVGTRLAFWVGMRTAYQGPRDVIDLGAPGALRHFTRALGCSVEQLRAAVLAAGTSFEHVRMRFRRRPMTRRRHAAARDVP